MEPVLFGYLKHLHQRIAYTQLPVLETTPVMIDMVAALLAQGYVVARISRMVVGHDGKMVPEVAIVTASTESGEAMLRRVTP